MNFSLSVPLPAHNSKSKFTVRALNPHGWVNHFAANALILGLIRTNFNTSRIVFLLSVCLTASNLQLLSSIRVTLCASQIDLISA
jgi:hypothetical protein